MAPKPGPPLIGAAEDKNAVGGRHKQPGRLAFVSWATIRRIYDIVNTALWVLAVAFVAVVMINIPHYYLPGTDEVISAEMASPSPDDRFHHCFYYPLAKVVDPWAGPVWESKPKTRCFFAPMNST
jgi:hypothetical protein